ncbi:hypothetical protein [Achromobacter piechaudii]|uniref:hypothetical protein n=1 Tax=Achromobacter piechaudii TaxID=72556 RepID=UPI003DA9CBF5
MKVDANFRRRAAVGENVQQLNSNVVSKLSKIDGLFSNNDAESRAAFDPGDGESAATNLSMCFRSGIRGSIVYRSRIPGMVADKGTSDDFIALELDLEEVDYFWFATQVFPEIVKIFGAYRSSIVTDLDREIDDFDEIVKLSRSTGLDLMGRDGIFRIDPVNYFDDILCMRAFGIGSREVAARLAGQVDIVEEIGSGVFFVVGSTPVSGDESICLDKRIKKILAGQ